MRLFWAVELPEVLRRSCDAALEPIRSAAPQLKWVAPERLHVTLKFLGEVEESSLSAVTGAGGEALEGDQPFPLRLGEFGSFPSAGAVRVVWLGIQGEVAALVGLARRLEDAMALLGIARERRPFAAHLTLARSRRARGGKRGRATLTVDGLHRLAERVRVAELQSPFEVREVVLMRSHLQSGGPIYEALARIALCPGRP